MKINMNDWVEVKLTQRGIDFLHLQHNELYEGWPDAPKFVPPTAIDGVSRWQLWDLMGKFAEFMQVPSMDLPFDPTITIVSAEQPITTRAFPANSAH